MASEDSDYADFDSDREEQNFLLISSKKNVRDSSQQLLENTDGNYLYEEEEDDSNHGNKGEDSTKNAIDPFESQVIKKDEDMEPKKTSAKDKKILNANKKLKHKTGIIYLSSIPPYMKPAKMRQILSRFGDVDRLFLKRESEQKHKQRVRGGGNKKVIYEEGWAEFKRKRDAKLCATTLNGNIIGGKKGSFYHDDILNVKYLPGFKWTDLTEQIARENDIRQSKLEREISLANKLNAEYAKNVEMSKTITNMRKSKKRSSADQTEIHRNFKQHKVSTARADAPENIKNKNSSSQLGSVLNNLL